MKSRAFINAAALSVAAVVGISNLAIPGKASGASLSLLDSGVQAYFGSQGPVYEASDPVVAAWTPPGLGPYPSGLPLPNLPAAPTPLVFPSPSGNAFGGAGYTSNFNDVFSQPTTASSTIQAYYNPSPAVTSDASIQIPSWTLAQSAGSPSYAYEQLNFAADYSLNGGALAGSTPNFPLTVSGNVSIASGVPSYAQFDGVINYTWATYNTITGVLDPQQSLGQLDFSYLSSSIGPFSGTTTSSGTLLGTPSNQGVLEITGEMWVAGDPSAISVSTAVPEPASLGLLAVGMMTLRRRSRRRPAD